MPRIFVDARMMGPDVSRGIGRVVREFLLRALPEPGIDWIVLVRNRGQLAGLPGRFQAVVEDIPWYGFAEQVRLPMLLARVRPDFAFYPHWNVPVFAPWIPFACFVHDLILFHHPLSAKVGVRHPVWAGVKRFVQRQVVRYVAWRARDVFVPTEFVAADVRSRFPGTAAKVRVVGEGIAALPEPSVPDAPLSGPYFLTVGGAYPHKRLDLALRAWERLSAAYPRHTLVLVGERDVFRGRLEEEARRLGLPRVAFPGAVSDAELSRWYAHADALIFPSADEGFGLPPLEALSFGCPVLSSDAACLPEVLPSRGVVFFRNGDLDDMMAKWNDLARDLARLRTQVPAGFAEAARRHSWDGMARRLRSYFPAS